MSRYYPAVSRKSFWFDKHWPREAPDGSHVFLGNAVLATGQAIFGAEWSDEDPQAAFSHKESVVAERARVTEVMERLGVAIARGDVRFALRPDPGGDFKPQKEAVDPRTSALVGFGKANWNVDDFTPMFKYAQMNDGKYRVEQAPPLDWIYLERESFQRFIAGLIQKAPDSDRTKGEPFARSVLSEAVQTGQMSPIQEKFIDEAAQDGVFFWSNYRMWPRDTREHVFLARVVNQFGLKLFPDDWKEDEMLEIFMPRLSEESTVSIKPGSNTALYLSSVAEAVEKNHGVKLEPLEGFFRYIADDRSKSRERIANVADMLIDAVVHGELKIFGQRIGGGTAFEEMPALEWTKDEAIDWFMFCHQGPYAHSPARLKRTLSAHELPNFLFVQRSSLDQYMQLWERQGEFFPYRIRYHRSTAAEPGPVSSAGGADATSDAGADDTLATVEGGARRKSKRTRVEPFIERIFPGGIPDEISDTQVYRLIAKAMDEAARKDPLLEGAPSRETILRAAGRK